MTFHAERHMRLREAYDSLSEPMRMALKLRIGDKLPASLVGRRLGLSTEEARELITAALDAWVKASA